MALSNIGKSFARGDAFLQKASREISEKVEEAFTQPTLDAIEELAAKPRLPTDSAERKNYPLVTGVLDYFPDALMEVARLSKIGNDKHNPGQPLHWSRDKSNDHADTIGRHLLERGLIDTDQVLHDAKIAWRSLAMLQETIERQRGLPVSRGSKAA